MEKTIIEQGPNKITKALTKNGLYTKWLKYLIIAVLGLFIVSTVIYLIAGFNLSNEVRDKQVVTIDFKQTVTQEDRTAIENKISQFAKLEGFNELIFEKNADISIDEANLLVVKVIDFDKYNETEINDKFANIKTKIMDEYEDKYHALTVSDNPSLEVVNLNNFILLPLLAFGIFVVLLFFYVWIRYQLVYAIASVVSVVLATTLMFSIMLLFRLPFGTNYSLILFITMFLTAIIYLVLASLTKLKITSQEAYTNSQINLKVLDIILPIILTIFIPTVLISLVLSLILIITSETFVALSIISVIISVLISIAVPIYIGQAIWVERYNYIKDKRLQNRIDKKKLKDLDKKYNKKTNDDDDKILV